MPHLPHMITPTKKIFPAAAAIAFLGLSGQALAFDAKSYFERLQAEAAKNGTTITYGSIDGSGDDAVVSDITVIGKKPGDKITIERLELTGAEEIGFSGFSFNTMNAANISVTSPMKEGGTATFSLGNMNAEDFSLPQINEGKYPFWPVHIGNASIGNLEFERTGEYAMEFSLPSASVSELVPGEDGNFSIGAFSLAQGEGSTTLDGEKHPLTFGAINISNAKRHGPYSFSVDSLDMGGSSMFVEDKEGKLIDFSFAGLDLKNLYVPDYSDENSPLFPEGDTVFNVGSMVFKQEGKEVITFDGMSGRNSYDASTETLNAVVKVDSFVANIENMPSSNDRNTQNLIALGITKLDLGFDADVVWNLASGDMEVKQARYNVEDIAALDIVLSISGYTKELARKIQTITTQMQTEKDPEKQQALGMQMLGEISALRINSVSVKLEDDSITNRILDEQARRSGQTKQQLVETLPFVAGAGLAQLQLSEMAEQVSAAVGTFLKSPGTLTLSAKPDQPVTVPEIMSMSAGVKAGTVKPAEIVERLNVSIQANGG